MNWRGLLPKVLYERLYSGQQWYHINKDLSVNLDFDNKLDLIASSSVLIPVFDLLTHYFSNTKFYLEDNNGNKIEDHPILDLIENPNYFQSKEDFLSQHILFKYAFGWNYMFPIIPTAFDTPTKLYNLRSDLVEFPIDFKPKLLNVENLNQKFLYDKENEALQFSLKDIIPFYDQPSGVNREIFKANSRIDGVKEEIRNVTKALQAKGIVIETNGKELFSTRASNGIGPGMLNETEKGEIQQKLNTNFGLTQQRSRSLVTKADIRWQSLHIPLIQLGLDDSIAQDAQRIVTAFNIPKELISFSTEGSTYENQERAKIDFIQSSVRKDISDFCNSLKNAFKLDLKIKGTLSHLPIMESTEMRRTRNLLAYGKYLEALVKSSILTTEEAKIKAQEYEKRQGRD